MRLSFLDPLYAQPGPYSSAYLDTSTDVGPDDIEEQRKAVELRWRHLRDQLAAQGADPATVAAMADVVGSDLDLAGRHGQAIFAAGGRLALAAELPDPPARDVARHDPLPDTMPLVLERAPSIPYIAVLVTRGRRQPSPPAGEQAVADRGAGEQAAEDRPLGGEEGRLAGRSGPATRAALASTFIEVTIQPGCWPISKVTPSMSVRRRAPLTSWRRASAQIARELEDMARAEGAEVIAVAGDTWARGDLVNQLPKVLRNRVRFLNADGAAVAGDRRPAAGAEAGQGAAAPGGGAGAGAGAGVGEVESNQPLLGDRLRELFRGRMAARDRAQVEIFLAQRARNPEALEGMAATVAALRRGQARAVLINPPRTPFERVLPGSLWIGPEPTQIALSAEELRSLGVDEPREEPADAALIRAIVGTGAELVVVSRSDVAPADGVGVLLRYTDPATGPQAS